MIFDEGMVEETIGHDLVVVAMQDQNRHVDLLQILGQIRFENTLDAAVAGGHAGHHALKPGRLAHALLRSNLEAARPAGPI